MPSKPNVSIEPIHDRLGSGSQVQINCTWEQLNRGLHAVSRSKVGESLTETLLSKIGVHNPRILRPDNYEDWDDGPRTLGPLEVNHYNRIRFLRGLIREGRQNEVGTYLMENLDWAIDQLLEDHPELSWDTQR